MVSEREEVLRVLQGHLDRQEWDEAIAGLVKLSQRSPQNLKLHHRLAQLYLKTGNAGEALERFRHCAEGFYKRNRYREALEIVYSLKPDPNDIHMLNLSDSIEKALQILKREVPKNVNDQ